MNSFDVIIRGKGPSGISAALYTIRANLRTLIIGKADSSLMKAPKIENYFGLSEPVSGDRLLAIGEGQAKKLGVTILDEEVVSISKLYDENLFKVITSVSEYIAKAILIATGKPQKKINIEGVQRFEGK